MNKGLKILKQDKSKDSSNIDDYVFWSKYPPLTLLEKKTTIITVTDSGCSGTISVPHSYGFIPLVIGTVKKTDGSPTGDNNNRYFMPAEDFAGINCDVGLIPVLSFNYTTRKDRVDITYTAECVLMGFPSCPLTNQVFTIELYFYMWEMGTKFPFS